MSDVAEELETLKEPVEPAATEVVPNPSLYIVFYFTVEAGGRTIHSGYGSHIVPGTTDINYSQSLTRLTAELIKHYKYSSITIINWKPLQG